MIIGVMWLSHDGRGMSDSRVWHQSVPSCVCANDLSFMIGIFQPMKRYLAYICGTFMLHVN